MSSQQNQSNYYAVIPASVRYCKELEPNAKLLYGEITALCNQEGYCWAGNHYFEDLYEVDERSIRRWLESLKNANFIRVEVEKKGFKTLRKIWICESFQGNFTTGQKCPPRQDKNVRLDRAKLSPIIIQCSNTISKKKKQQQEPAGGAAVFYECLKKIDLTDKEKKSLMKYSEQEVKDAISFVFREGFTVKKTIIQALMWAIKEKPELPKPVDIGKNLKYAQSAESNLTSKGWNLEALSKMVIINCKSPANSTEYQVKYDNPNFKNELNSLLKKYNFK